MVETVWDISYRTVTERKFKYSRIAELAGDANTGLDTVNRKKKPKSAKVCFIRTASAEQPICVLNSL